MMEARRIACQRPSGAPRESRKAAEESCSFQLKFEVVVFGLCGVVLVAAALNRAFPLKPRRAPSSAPTTITVTVQPGDTIWGIARRVSGNGADLRRVVHSISELNQLENARIRPGQALLAPADEQLDVGRRLSSSSVD